MSEAAYEACGAILVNLTLYLSSRLMALWRCINFVLLLLLLYSFKDAPLLHWICVFFQSEGVFEMTDVDAGSPLFPIIEESDTFSESQTQAVLHSPDEVQPLITDSGQQGADQSNAGQKLA